MPLIDTAVRHIKPGVKSIKLFDERGLYLEISPLVGNGGVSNIASTVRKKEFRWVSIQT